LDYPKPILVKKALFPFIILFISAQFVFAQQEKLYPFAHFNLNNGLAAYNANTIVQDKDGFVWIGTINGLQRFDGHKFLTFHRVPGDNRSMPDNYIDHLFLDSRQNLWLVLGNGEVGTFDTRRFVFRKAKINVGDDRITKLPRKLTEDSDGNLLYIIYGHEITSYNSKLNEFSPTNSNVLLPPNWKAIGLVEQPSAKRYWIATDSGMCVFNTRTRAVSYRGHNTEKIGFIERFGGNVRYQNLMLDDSSRLWYTTNAVAGSIPSINCYSILTDSQIVGQQALMSQIKTEYDVKRILYQDDGSVWLTGMNSFMKYNPGLHRFVPVSSGPTDREINFEEVNYLFEDREKNIWLSTSNNGVYIFKPSNPLFTSVRHFNRSAKTFDEGAVIALTHDSGNTLFASVTADGLHKFDIDDKAYPEKPCTPDEKKPYTIWSICPLKDGRTFWMGTSSGIVVYDNITGTSEYHNPAMLGNKLIRSIAEDKLGNIWLALPAAGVFKWNSEKGTKDFESGFVKFNGTPQNLIEKITVDSKGFVWVCTLMNGVYKIDPATDKIIEHLTSSGPEGHRLLSDAATDAFEYDDTTMIFPTGALNFYNTRTGVITPVSSADGLPSDIVRSIEKDKRNHLWLGMFNGLCRMNVAKKSFTYYDRNDGMANDNFNYSSSTHLKDGRLVFGTTTDLVIFNPEQLNSSGKPGNVYITEFRVKNRPLSVDSLFRLQKVELGPGQDFITIGFSGLSFYNNKWSYYYKMDGLDKEWKNTNGIFQVNYNYLPAGTYTFEVRAENADGVTSDEITRMKIVVQPPLLKSWWFYSIVILFVAFILYMIDRERMRKNEMIQKMRSDIASSLHGEVNSALNKINILSEMARIKAEKEPAKAPEFFEQIHQKSHEMIVAMDDMLWSIAPENDSMGKTIDRLREYIDALKNRHAANIDLLVDRGIESLQLNMKLRYELFVLMKEGIRSVLQAGTKNCKVHIGEQEHGLLYTLEISNKNCDLQQLNNLIQQIELERRLNSINATLNSKMHKFTSVFDLYVPL
jgi:ligand-binding sensor domain-containing protein